MSFYPSMKFWGGLLVLFSHNPGLGDVGWRSSFVCLTYDDSLRRDFGIARSYYAIGNASTV